MSVKEVLMIGNDKLRQVSEYVNFKNDNIKKIITDLKDTINYLIENERSGTDTAIAAIQIGYPKRIVFMNYNDQEYVLINPEIIDKSNEKVEIWDTCLSVDIRFLGKVSRHKKITVEYYDEKQNKIIKHFDGFLAKIFQHEMDHLNAKLFIDNIIDNQIITWSEWEKVNVPYLTNL